VQDRCSRALADAPVGLRGRAKKSRLFVFTSFRGSDSNGASYHDEMGSENIEIMKYRRHENQLAKAKA